MEQRFETFTVLINRISRSIRKIKNQEMAAYRLRSVHVSCLYYLYVAGDMAATDLCERCEEDKATVSRALSYLEAEGYLTCASRQSKRYKAPLALTEKGREVGGIIAGKIGSVLDEVSTGLTEEERIIFYRSLGMISDHLEAVARRNENERNE